MKKAVILLAMALAVTSVRADEGMWMLPTLKKMNQADMKKLGLKIGVSDLYNENLDVPGWLGWYCKRSFPVIRRMSACLPAACLRQNK